MIYSQILLDIIYHYDTMLDLYNYALSERNASLIHHFAMFPTLKISNPVAAASQVILNFVVPFKKAEMNRNINTSPYMFI